MIGDRKSLAKNSYKYLYYFGMSYKTRTVDKPDFLICAKLSLNFHSLKSYRSCKSTTNIHVLKNISYYMFYVLYVLKFQKPIPFVQPNISTKD